MLKTYKLNPKFTIMMVILAGIGIMAISTGISMLKDGIVEGEDNRVLGIAFIVVGASWIWSAVMMLALRLIYKGTGMELTKDGIESSFVCLNLLAFMFVAPVEFIPWDAVEKFDVHRGVYFAVVDTSKVKAGFMGKILLKLAGFSFGAGFVTPKVGLKDIDHIRSCIKK